MIAPSASSDFESQPPSAGDNPDPVRSPNVPALTPGRAWVIPEVEAAELESRLRSVVVCRRDEYGLLRRVGPHDPAKAFTFEAELGGAVSGLVPLVELTTFHSSGYGLFFKPSANEVAAQIPTEFVGRIAAFETVPMDDDVRGCWSQEHGMHQAVTTLYAAPQGVIETPVDDAARRANKISRLRDYVAPTAEELDPRFSTVDLCVLTFSGDEEACWSFLARDRGLPWQQDPRGLVFTVGYHQDQPLCVAASWVVVDDKRVLFLGMCSRVIDSTRLEDWIRTNLASTPKISADELIRLSLRNGGEPGESVPTPHSLSVVESPDHLRDVTCFVEAGKAAVMDIERDVSMQGYTWMREPRLLLLPLISPDGESMSVELEVFSINGRRVAFYRPCLGPLDQNVFSDWLDKNFTRAGEPSTVRRINAINFSLRDAIR